MFTPELLPLAGTLKNMRYAFAYGADAVWFVLASRATAYEYTTTSSAMKTWRRVSMKPMRWARNFTWW